jgi:hypothetical protein
VVSGAARVGLARPTQQVVDGPLGAVRAARVALNGVRAETWSNTSMTSNGNEVRVVDPAQRRRKKLQIR